MPYSLVPYRESMRMGMRFNSYTHKLCMDGVGCHADGELTVKESPNSFMYSSRIVERLSDIATAMEISQSDTMIQGSFDRTGSGTFVDTDNIIAADVNVLVSVKVMSRTSTTTAPDDFQGVGVFDPGSDVFHKALEILTSRVSTEKDDTTSILTIIPGFVEGGYFISIISIRCLDGSDRNSVLQVDIAQTQTYLGDLNETHGRGEAS
ncbi:hypothetical protein FLAG1_10765 [Fusarium langsethiae]|uniref:Uncharacterized protein n=1 Tax=Fusarium langsethiae TaxID=179993 RepID=A0A0M9ENP5_FUSLA|nr:hypothetical protein FLAG1_10765 [Fusarium langsethiae]GKU17089.1 unnamed protein product [Fusarium langsethiae]GKU21683.1 unnamed protein product [Fusarium langsethiae]